MAAPPSHPETGHRALARAGRMRCKKVFAWAQFRVGGDEFVVVSEPMVAP